MSKAPSEAESLNVESNLDLDYETDFDIASPDADEGPQGSIVTSEEYYFEDGDLFILVDDALFRVHEHFLSSSANHSFRATVGNGNEGWNESKPIILHNISKQDFQDVLWVFYDETLRRKASAEKWLGILLTAEKLQIQRIQTLAVGKLAKMEPPNVDPIARIAVQQRYNMDMAWAKDAFMDVVQRTEPLTEEEAIDIGTFATVTIAYLRTPHGKQMKKGRSPWPWSPEPLAMVWREQEPEPAFYILPRNVHGCSVTVAGHAFCVHPHILKQQSPILREMLSTNSSISLPDVTSSTHFSWLLRLFYDETFDMEAKPVQLALMRRIAGLYKMDAVTELTTERMKDTMTDIEQVKAIDLHQIEDKYSKEPWDAICQRPVSLNPEEGRHLGPRLCARIARERELRGKRS